LPLHRDCFGTIVPRNDRGCYCERSVAIPCLHHEIASVDFVSIVMTRRVCHCERSAAIPCLHHKIPSVDFPRLAMTRRVCHCERSVAIPCLHHKIPSVHFVSLAMTRRTVVIASEARQSPVLTTRLLRMTSPASQ